MNFSMDHSKVFLLSNQRDQALSDYDKLSQRYKDLEREKKQLENKNQKEIERLHDELECAREKALCYQQNQTIIEVYKKKVEAAREFEIKIQDQEQQIEELVIQIGECQRELAQKDELQQYASDLQFKLEQSKDELCALQLELDEKSFTI